MTHRAPGGEAALLAELARLGLACEAATQLVCVCEVRSLLRAGLVLPR